MFIGTGINPRRTSVNSSAQRYTTHEYVLLASLSFCSRHAANDIGVTWISDAQRRHPVVLAARRTELNVVAGVVMHARLSQHRVVLNLALTQWRRVVRNDDKFSLALTKSLQRLSVAEHELTALHNQCQTSIDALNRLFLCKSLHRILIRIEENALIMTRNIQVKVLQYH